MITFQLVILKLTTDTNLKELWFVYGDCYDAYRAMEDLYAECKVKAIGVCNFIPDRFVDFSRFVKVQPQINQVKTHVFFQQRELRKYMDKYNTQIMAWAPLAEGKHDFFKNETLKSIGQKNYRSNCINICNTRRNRSYSKIRS